MNTALLKLAISNVSVGGRREGTVSVCCDYNGAHYHFWLNPVTGKREDTLYKNPITGRPEFSTKKLDITSGPSSRLVEAMLEVYHAEGLLKKFEEVEAREEAEHKAELAKEMLLRRKQAAAEELFASAKRLIAAIDDHRDARETVGRQAEALRRILNRVESGK